MSELPESVVDRAETLTRRAREAVDGAEREAYLSEREALLADCGYAARTRDEGDREVLVCYPESWIDDGTVRIDRIEDTERAVERQLSGTGTDEWSVVDEHNRTIAERIGDEHGPVHGETARAFADFMSNHYLKRIERATPREREEFRAEYLPRNAWPTDEQLSLLDRSMELLADAADYA